jgi:trimethylamine--corrinoid protein Co-methyltransferase
LTLWDGESCRRIHDATVHVLSTTGVEVLAEEGRAALAGVGAEVCGTRVRIREGLVEAAIASAPTVWQVPARGPVSGLELRLGNVYFGTGSDCIYVRDVTEGRRRGTMADVREMAALCERMANMDFVMSMALPHDVPQVVDDLAQLAAMLEGTRKPILMSPRTGEVIGTMKRMAEWCGAGESLMVYGMPAPPLTHDADGVGKIIACAEHGVPLVYASAPCCGTTAPASVAAGVVVSNAEVLSGLVLHQAVREGAPFVYGCGLDVLNMRTMVAAYCLPESLLGLQAMSDLARLYGLPSFSYAGMSDSKTLDEQWALEAAFTALTGALSRATLLHDVGYLESGLQSSLDSIVLGDELVGYARAFMDGVRVDDETLALEEIEAVGPGGNHLARPYTRRHFREFWRPGLLDQSVHDRWQAGGALTLADRVRARVEELRGEGPVFALPPETRRKLEQLLAEQRRA